VIAATQLRAGNAASARAAAWLAAEAIAATRAVVATRTASQGGEIVLRADSAVGPDGSAHPRISPRSQREDRASDIHPWIMDEARPRHQPFAAVAGHTAWVDVGRTGGTFLRALTV
jgi:hypothetical protein